jgi:TIR domain
MRIFVAYTTIDKEISREFLLSLRKRVSIAGKVFIDLIDNDSTDKQERVISELDNSDILLLVNTQNVSKSKWVSIELDRAEERKIPIIMLSPAEVIEMSDAAILKRLAV